MSQQEQNSLKQQQKHLMSIYLSTPNRQAKLQQTQELVSNSQIDTMLLTLFEIDQMKQQDFNDIEEQSLYMGFEEQRNLHFSYQQKSLPQQVHIFSSISTQTDDFTFINALFSQPKIYEIPVQLELFQQKQLEQKSVQVPEHLQFGGEQKQQQQFPAVQRQRKLMMDSGVIFSKVYGHQFSLNDEFSHRQQNLHLEKLNNHQKQEKSNDSDDSKNEIIDSRQVSFENNQNLFKAPQSQLHSYHLSNTYSPSKSIFAETQSSSYIHGDMRISERQINMMKSINLSTERITQEEYESLQCKIYILEQQNSQKNDKIDELSRKITQLQNQISRLGQIKEQNQRLQVKCKTLQRKLVEKDSYLDRLTENLAQLYDKVKKCQQAQESKQQQIQKILIKKQKQIQHLQNQINLLQQQIYCDQQKSIKEIQALQSVLHEREIEIYDLRAEYDRKYDIYISSIKQMKERINQYEIKMEQMQSLIKDKNKQNSQVKKDSIKLNFICEESNLLNLSHQKIIKSSYNDAMIDSSTELQRTILIYQGKIKNQLEIIKQLEEKVIELIKDALTKQKEAKLLLNQLCQCQNSIKSLHVQKLQLELQNKRMKRIIQDSQNKLIILGNRLVKLAKANTTLGPIQRRNLNSMVSLELK